MASKIPGAWRSSIASRVSQRPFSVTGVRSTLNDAGVVKSFHLGAAHAEHASEHGLGVAAEHRRSRRWPAGRAVQANGNAHHLHGAGLSVGKGHHHAARLEMLALADLWYGADPTRRHAGRLQTLQPIRRRTRAENLVEQRHERRAVLDARRNGGVARLLGEL